MKKLKKDDLIALRDRLYLEIPDEKLDEKLPPYFTPGLDSPEHKYMLERRAELGGSIPKRRRHSRPLPQPLESHFDANLS